MAQKKIFFVCEQNRLTLVLLDRRVSERYSFPSPYWIINRFDRPAEKLALFLRSYPSSQKENNFPSFQSTPIFHSIRQLDHIIVEYGWNCNVKLLIQKKDKEKRFSLFSCAFLIKITFGCLGETKATFWEIKGDWISKPVRLLIRKRRRAVLTSFCFSEVRR